MSIFTYKMKDLSGNERSMREFENKVLLIVNTASECGLASQLSGLEDLYRKYKDEGFEILAFPSNQFMGQEPLEGMDIQKFCETNYDITFPLFEKVKVNGNEAHPIYKHLKEETGSKMLKWNYTKFLVNRDGEVVDRFAPVTKPEKITDDIESLL